MKVKARWTFRADHFAAEIAYAGLPALVAVDRLAFYAKISHTDPSITLFAHTRVAVRAELQPLAMLLTEAQVTCLAFDHVIAVPALTCNTVCTGDKVSAAVAIVTGTALAECGAVDTYTFRINIIYFFIVRRIN